MGGIWAPVIFFRSFWRDFISIGRAKSFGFYYMNLAQRSESAFPQTSLLTTLYLRVKYEQIEII